MTSAQTTVEVVNQQLSRLSARLFLLRSWCQHQRGGPFHGNDETIFKAFALDRMEAAASEKTTLRCRRRYLLRRQDMDYRRKQ